MVCHGFNTLHHRCINDDKLCKMLQTVALVIIGHMHMSIACFQ